MVDGRVLRLFCKIWILSIIFEIFALAWVSEGVCVFRVG